MEDQYLNEFNYNTYTQTKFNLINNFERQVLNFFPKNINYNNLELKMYN